MTQPLPSAAPPASNASNSSTGAALRSLAQPTIVLFGDSITEHSFDVQNGGWGARLANEYARKADVVNRGQSVSQSTMLC